VVGMNLTQIALGVRCVFASLFTCVNRRGFSVGIAPPDDTKSAARESVEALFEEYPLVTE
jgi:hypothetical protein